MKDRSDNSRVFGNNAKSMDYESKTGTSSGSAPYLEGSTLWVSDKTRLPPICLCCGRQDELVEQTYTLRNSTKSFTYFMCATDARSDRRVSRGVVVVLVLLNASVLIVSIALRFAQIASTGVLFGVFILLYLLQMGCLAIGTTSRLFTIRGQRRDHFGVTGIEPVLLPYFVHDRSDHVAEL